MSEVKAKTESVVRRLRALVGPAPPQETSTRPRLLEDALLSALVRANPQKHSTATVAAGDVRWRFVSEAIDVLRDVRDLYELCSPYRKEDATAAAATTMTEEEEAKSAVLSIGDRGLVTALVQTVVAWGVYPSLLPGVGIDINRRLTKTRFQMDTSRPGNRSELSLCASVLLSLAKLDAFSGEMATSHSGDLFASHIQLVYAPPPNGDRSDSEATSGLTYLMKELPVDITIDTVTELLATRPPKWMGIACGKLLGDSVVKPGGLFVLIDRMLRSHADENGATEERQLQTSDEDISRVVFHVTTAPRHIAKAEYLSSICQQLRGILQLPRDRVGEGVLRAAVLCVRRILDTEPSFAREVVIGKLLLPFTEPLAVDSAGAVEERLPGSVVFSEAEFESTVTALVRLLTMEYLTAEIVAQLATPMFSSLFGLCAFCSSGVSSMKGASRDVVLSCLRHAKSPSATILALARDQSPRSRRFAHGSSGGVEIVVPTATASDGDGDVDREVACLVSIIEELHDESVPGEVFIALLRDAASIGDDVAGDGSLPCSALGLSLLAALPERFGARLTSDVVQVCHFVSAMLEREDDASVGAAVGIVAAVLSAEATVAPEHAFLFHALVPALERVARFSNCDHTVSESAAAVLASITSSSPSWVAQPTCGTRSEPAAANVVPAVMRDIEMELADPIAAVRGGALIRLRRLILSRDPAVVSSVPAILRIFVDHLNNEDDFVFGAAIAGLCGLGDLFPAQVIEPLAASFADHSLKEKVRAKVGEALMQVLLVQGDMLHAYLPICINSILGGIRDTASAPTRASAVSLLASVLGAVPVTTLDSFSAEAVNAVCSVLKTDSDDEVRRAAAIASLFLCRSFCRDYVTARAHKQPLLELVSALRIAAHMDADELVRGHCTIALEEASAELLVKLDDDKCTVIL